jgi:hypothetical protein
LEFPFGNSRIILLWPETSTGWVSRSLGLIQAMPIEKVLARERSDWT